MTIYPGATLPEFLKSLDLSEPTPQTPTQIAMHNSVVFWRMVQTLSGKDGEPVDWDEWYIKWDD